MAALFHFSEGKDRVRFHPYGGSFALFELHEVTTTGNDTVPLLESVTKVQLIGLSRGGPQLREPLEIANLGLLSEERRDQQ